MQTIAISTSQNTFGLAIINDIKFLYIYIRMRRGTVKRLGIFSRIDRLTIMTRLLFICIHDGVCPQCTHSCEQLM